MKQFLFTVALTFALTAGAVTVLTVQLTRAAAQTLSSTLIVLTVQPQPAAACAGNSRC
jgi:hypothetical protein